MEMSMATPQNSSTAGREKGERTLIDDDVYERHERTLIGMPCADDDDDVYYYIRWKLKLMSGTTTRRLINACLTGRGACRGGARGAVRQETLMSGTTVTTTTRRRRPSITAIVTAIAIMMLVVPYRLCVASRYFNTDQPGSLWVIAIVSR